MYVNIRRLALASCIGMLLVVLAGVVVTQTGSGEGCGDDWPLCEGKFVPDNTRESITEYSHRFVTGIEGILVLLTTIFVFKSIKSFQARFYAGSALFFTILQAILGLLAVKNDTSELVMALHFGISLLAFASTLLLVLHLREMSQQPTTWNQRDDKDRIVTMRFMYLVWGALIYTYVVIYLGAYVRHSNAVSGCGDDWPLCNGQWFPGFTGETGAAFIHRLGAITLFFVIAIVAHIGYRHYYKIASIRKSSIYIIVFIVVQILSGALLVKTLSFHQVYLFTSLLHSIFITALFSVLCYLSIQVWLWRKVK
ncbi:COX15/CtaA family protein [Longirhabdus pacifica]|uniref:COX15/CtaA family protein n=1 Tax=Longirhabdus pacifica TaxID=2305227 RepID=UPI001008E961|nr:COX15/CtaA family protein [Longirhabdus pacifica]